MAGLGDDPQESPDAAAAVSELVALHNVPIDSIVERVAYVAETERGEAVVPPAT